MLFTFGAVAFDLLTFHSLLVCIFPCSTQTEFRTFLHKTPNTLSVPGGIKQITTDPFMDNVNYRQ